ncbi:MAG: MBOAT family protein [Lachnospiraceae bacterium]|nr:MBOAT family protein [Lachnospiraceae bacterium]
MEITSLVYPVYLIVFLAVYFALSKSSLQIYAILAASLIYMTYSSGISGTVICVLLCLFLWLIGRRLKGSRPLLFLGLFLDLGLLLYFKFFTGIFDSLFTAVTAGERISIRLLAAPAGLSYFSLAVAAYLVDCYKGKIEAEKNYFHFLTYVTFFPALHQGPFNLYKDLMPKLRERHVFNEQALISGAQRILWGYFQKMVIADRLHIFVSNAIPESSVTGIVLFFTMILYSFQIYADFAGGIDIIMGLTEIMGIGLPENFRSPLVAVSVADFWKRWHITLGTIMEKYVYYPLVLGKRMRAVSKLIRNKYLSRVFAAAVANFLVFILVGIWHGTGWNYVVYGIYQAVFTTSAILLAPVYKNIHAKLHINPGNTAYRIYVSVRTFVVLVFGRYFTRAGSLTLAFEMFRRTFISFSAWRPSVLFDGTLLGYGLEFKNLILALLCMALMVAVDIIHYRNIRLRRLLMTRPFALRLAVYYALIFGIIIFGIYGEEYSASAFIYAQF